VSDIFEIRHSGDGLDPIVSVPAMPMTAWPETCEALASLALEHATAGDHVLAGRAARDAMLMLDSLLGEPTMRQDRSHGLYVAAGAALTTGEALLLLREAHRAKACFTTAARIFDGLQDLRKAADARVALAKALLVLHDPSARAVLEDAGELYEELDDQEAVRAIDFALRQANAEFAESPRSFHATAELPVTPRA
jgi:hypothetical protein